MKQSRSPIAKSGVRSGRGLLQQFVHGPVSDVRSGLTSHIGQEPRLDTIKARQPLELTSTLLVASNLTETNSMEYVPSQTL